MLEQSGPSHHVTGVLIRGRYMKTDTQGACPVAIVTTEEEAGVSQLSRDCWPSFRARMECTGIPGGAWPCRRPDFRPPEVGGNRFLMLKATSMGYFVNVVNV